ncbi:HotDog domain-containing protein [Russula compacta]|nr:HotDog domain-containing protein [Russula compacta]
MPPTRRPPGSQPSTDSNDASFRDPEGSLPTPACSRSPDAAGRHYWVDPRALPDSSSRYKVADITGNVPQDVKRLTCNTLASYGIGGGDGGAFGVGEALEVTEMHVVQKLQRLGRFGSSNVLSLSSTTGMVNGAGVAHGGCIAYILDNSPLVVLGLLRGINAVGVTQNMHITYHAPAPLGTHLRIVSTSVALGKRVMNARCEVSDKKTGRLIATGFVSRMQPLLSATSKL